MNRLINKQYKKLANSLISALVSLGLKFVERVIGGGGAAFKSVLPFVPTTTNAPLFFSGAFNCPNPARPAASYSLVPSLSTPLLIH